jgi:hypothetical protein
MHETPAFHTRQAEGKPKRSRSMCEISVMALEYAVTSLQRVPNERQARLDDLILLCPTSCRMNANQTGRGPASLHYLCN